MKHVLSRGSPKLFPGLEAGMYTGPGFPFGYNLTRHDPDGEDMSQRTYPNLPQPVPARLAAEGKNGSQPSQLFKGQAVLVDPWCCASMHLNDGVRRYATQLPVGPGGRTFEDTARWEEARYQEDL